MIKASTSGFAKLSLTLIALLTASAALCGQGSLVPSSQPNLDAAKIASLGQAKKDGLEALGSALNQRLGDLAVSEAIARQSADLNARAKAAFAKGELYAVAVCEIFTNSFGYTEAGPVTLVTGNTLMGALKTYATTSTISKNRRGLTKSYKLLVMTKATASAGFTSELLSNELMAVAIGKARMDLESQAIASRDQAREAARQAAAEAAKKARDSTTREHDGARENSRFGEFRGNSRDSSGPKDSGPKDSGPKDSGPRDSGPKGSGDSGDSDTGGNGGDKGSLRLL